MDGIPLTSEPLLRAEPWGLKCPLSGSFSSFLRWRISSIRDKVSVEELGQGGGRGGGGGGGAAQRGVDVRAGGDIRGVPGAFWDSIRPNKMLHKKVAS